MRLLQLAKGLGALLGVVKPLNTSPPPVPQFAPVPAAWSDPAQYAATRLPVDEAPQRLRTERLDLEDPVLGPVQGLS